jgi:S-DNA-T family DNA segregation ATPase FtsK/SpoIIIE
VTPAFATVPHASEPDDFDAEPYDLSPYEAEPAPQMRASLAPTASAPAHEQKKIVQHPPRRAPQPSAPRATEAQPALQFEKAEAQMAFELPPLSLLTSPEGSSATT